MNQTPSSNRLHIGFFGKRNSGKSSIINAFTGQDVSVVSDVKGTTTDPVYKPMEINPLGACMIIDTAGYDDDQGKIGESRVLKTMQAAEKCDIAVIVVSDSDIKDEIEKYEFFKNKKISVLFLINKIDERDKKFLYDEILEKTGQKAVMVSALTGEGIDLIKENLAKMAPEKTTELFITRDLIGENEVALLVMPQDIQAPKGRLILPQAQTIRELLDKKCITVCCSADKMEKALSALSAPPKLIVTDSQVFDFVYKRKPEKSILTSFSVLFAAYKGDIKAYAEGAKAIDSLSGSSRVLIAECCTHAPMEEDIGRVKIPALLRQRYGSEMQIDVVSGADFPKDLGKYDLIIQCGGCMFNRQHILNRIEHAKEQNVPITNYGITIAHLKGVPITL